MLPSVVVRVVDGRYVGLAQRLQRALDRERLVADADDRVVHAERGEDGEVALQQSAAAETQQHLGLLDCQAPADTGGEHDGTHG